MDFIETPLDQVVDYFRDLHAIEIQLDTKALEEAGIGSDLPVTRTLKGVSLGSGLRLMVSPFDLTYVVRDGVMLITTQDGARKMVDLRVYDVQDLVGDDTDVQDVIAIVRLALAADGNSGDCTGASQILPLGNLLVVRTSINEQEAVADLLDEVRQKLKESRN